MYEDLLQTIARPFRATPDEKYYHPHESVETAKTTVVRAVRRAEGPVMVLGGVGLGKSLVGDLIASELRSEFDLVKLSAARLCSRRALLQNILFELDLPYRDLSEGELRLSIMDRLQPKPGYAPEGILLLVDEAHTLPSKLLEELRLITNFTRNGQPRVRLVLIGGMQLEDTFASPQMESFNQRLAARCYLTPMSREQTRRYVEHQISVAGYATSQLITEDGLQAVYAASEGVPRLVNQVMDHAFVLAVSRDQCPIGAQLIEEAWADLQQLPAPWQTVADRQQQANSTEVEFGALDDEDSEFSNFDIPRSADSVEAATSTASPTVETSPSDEPSAPINQAPTKQALTPPSVATEPSSNSFVEPDTAVESRQADNWTIAMQDENHDRRNESGGHNFFAAFEESEQMESLEDPADSPSQAPSVATEELLDKPEVMIVDVHKAFATGRHQSGHEHVEYNQALPADSFFENRPTDEKLIALEDEQRQYDAMGAWENDPPISTIPAPSTLKATAEDVSGGKNPEVDGDPRAEREFSTKTTKAASGDDPLSSPTETVIVDLSPTALFGEDFEEEIAINHGDADWLSSTEVLANRNIEMDMFASRNPVAIDESLVTGDESAQELPARQRRTAVAQNQGEATSDTRINDAVATPVADDPQSTDAAENGPTKTGSSASNPLTVMSIDTFSEIVSSEAAPDINGVPDFPPSDFDVDVVTEVVMLKSTLELATPDTQFVASELKTTSPQPAKLVPSDNTARAASQPQPKPVSKQFETTQLSGSIVDDLIGPDTVEAGTELVGSDITLATSDFADSVIPWTMEVGSVDTESEALVHREIEDIVSQLNFSAFAVEPFSVEQISLELSAEDTPARSNDSQSRPSNEPEYRRPATDIFNQETALYDDDRDLLIIEEDVAVAGPESMANDEPPPVRTAPYAQLFAKLRR